jgi:hypothetical protein
MSEAHASPTDRSDDRPAVQADRNVVRVVQTANVIATTRQHTAVAVTLGAILLVAAALRFSALDQMAPFVDEAGHIHAATDYSYFTFSQRLRFGKLFGYIAFYPTARFAAEPLEATRGLVGLMGVLTTLGVFLLTRRVASPAAALVASALWATMPYVVFHDRLALHDPLVTALIVWSLVGMNVAFDRQSRPFGVVAGLLLGTAVLTKVTAGVAIPWPVLAGLALYGVDGVKQRAGVVIGFAAGVTVLASSMAFAILVLGLDDQSVFLVQSADAWSWAGVWKNLGDAPNWFSSYNSMPFALLSAVTLVYALLKPSWLKVGLCLCVVVPIVAHALVFKVWVPRYLLFVLIPLVVLMGIVIAECVTASVAAVRHRFRQPGDWRVVAPMIGVLLLVAVSARHWAASDAAFLSNPSAASLPATDRFQYFDGWPSAGGIEAVAGYLNGQVREKGPAFLIVGGFGNHGWWALPLVPKLDPRLVIRSQHLFSSQVLAAVANDAKHQPTFLLFEPTRYEAPAFLDQASPQPQLVFEYKRPRSPGGFQLYALDRSVVVALEQRRRVASKPMTPSSQSFGTRTGRNRSTGGPSLGRLAAARLSKSRRRVRERPNCRRPTCLVRALPVGPAALTITGDGFAAQEEVGLGKKVVRVPVRPGTNLITYRARSRLRLQACRALTRGRLLWACADCA